MLVHLAQVSSPHLQKKAPGVELRSERAIIPAPVNCGGFLMSNSKRMNVLRRAWDALAAGDPDLLASFYADRMIFALPGQNDAARRAAFRAALDRIGQALPPGFKVTDLRYCVGENEIMNVVEWSADKVPAVRSRRSFGNSMTATASSRSGGMSTPSSGRPRPERALKASQSRRAPSRADGSRR